MRGGLGVRKRLSEESLRESYRLNGVQTSSVVVRAWDKYRGDLTKGFDVGILVRKTAATVYIHWAGDESYTVYSQGDARYEVDRGRWKFLGLMGPNPLDPNDPISIALTKLRESIKVPVSASPDNPTPTTDGVDETEEEDDDMAERMSKAAAERAAAQKQLEAGDLKDRETYTAKQVATRLGTDAKTMRKFFRSKNSTVEPVGQGGRYEFAAKDLPLIKREFDAWQTKAKTVRQKPKPVTEVHTEAEITAAKKQAKAPAPQEDPWEPALGSRDIDDDLVDPEAELRQAVKDVFGEDHEPTAEELEEMERIMELDLDEVD